MWTIRVEFDDGSLCVERLDDPLNVLSYVQLCLGGHPPRSILIMPAPCASSPAVSAPSDAARRRPPRPSSGDSRVSSLRR